MGMTREMLYHLGGAPVGLQFPLFRKGGGVYFVDGTVGALGNRGTAEDPISTLTKALTKVKEGDTIFVQPKRMLATDTDPGSYAETVEIITPNISIIGLSRGRTQGGLPQFKIGAGSTPMFKISAPGVLLANLGINGASSTGGGVLLNDDGGATAAAFGVTIVGCHFKNCKGHATDGTAGGAIYTTTSGNAWQLLVKGNAFYKNLAGIVMRGTGGSVPQDWVIEDNVFSSAANTDVDGDIYVAADGVKGLVIRRNTFATVDVPTSGSGTIGRYIKLGAGTSGIIEGCRFACISQGTGAKTFGAAGDAAIIPTTVRIAGCFGEPASDATGDSGDIFRT